MVARREDVPVVRISLGKQPWQAVSVYAFTAAEMGVPLVEIKGAVDYLEHLKPEQAEKFAEGLLLAARVARGEELPTPLDAFLASRSVK
jgi:hypothetical protein